MFSLISRSSFRTLPKTLFKSSFKRSCFSFSSVANGRLFDKVAVVTGGSAGIGRASSLVFSKEGAKVIVSDLDETGGQKVVDEINKLSGVKSAVFVKTDVSKSEQVQKLIQIAEEEFGKVNIIFNNAGVMLSEDGDENTEDNVWNTTFSVNVLGVSYGCKYGIPALKRAGGGSIINTASFVASVGAATAQLAYTASKGAVLSMTRELAVIHAKNNIRVNALSPGPLRTELLMKFLDTPEKKNRRLVHVPMGRFGEADEMAKSALFLASDESSYITGSDFLVDGGITAAYVTSE